MYDIIITYDVDTQYCRLSYLRTRSRLMTNKLQECLLYNTIVAVYISILLLKPRIHKYLDCASHKYYLVYKHCR